MRVREGIDMCRYDSFNSGNYMIIKDIKIINLFIV